MGNVTELMVMVSYLGNVLEVKVVVACELIYFLTEGLWFLH